MNGLPENVWSRIASRFCSFAEPRSTAVAAALLAVSFCLLPAAPASGQTVLRDGWKVQSSAKVTASGVKVSEPGFSTLGWYATSVPKTVFAVLVENGVYKDPYF